MKKANYAAWHIDSARFSDDWTDEKKLRFFARYAILAPSGHNTQPWRFHFDKSELTLKADNGRSLPYSGVQASEPYVSLGACLGILELAARGFGYKLAIKYSIKDSDIASIKLSGRINAEPTLLAAITGRVSNRHYYDTASLPTGVIAQLAQSDSDSVSVRAITERTDIDYLANLTAEATLITFADKEFRAELSKWVRNNITHQHDGMPGFVQGIPTPPSLLAKPIMKYLNVSKTQAKKDAERVRHSAGLIIVTVKNPNEAGLLDGGRAYAQICVRAQERQLATTGIGAAIIEPVTTKAAVEHFKLAGKPIGIIRLGKADRAAKHTPRWPLARVTD